MPVYRLQVRLRFPVGSGTGVNTWHVRTDELLDPQPDIADFAIALSNFYQAAGGLFCQGSTAAWDGTVSQVSAGTPDLVTGLTPWSRTIGAASGGASGAASMACVTWRSQLATRSGRGRTFLGPLSPTAVQADGTLAEASLSTLRNAATAFITAANGSTGSTAFVVWSESLQAENVVQVATVTDQVAVLRSRRS